MILYWAMGSGYGHLTRALGVIHTLKLQDRVIVASQLPVAAELLGGLPLLQVPDTVRENGKAIRPWLLAQIAKFDIDTVMLDVFPAGLYGEWLDLAADFADLRFEWVARHLKWETYRAAYPGALPRFAQVWMVETMPEAALAAVEGPACRIAQLELSYPAQPVEAAVQAQIAALPRPLWLLAHSGPVDEVEALLEHAREIAEKEGVSPAWIVVTPGTELDSDNIDLELSLYPVWPLFPHMDRMVTACGYNSMKQMTAFPGKHISLPFPRRWDDQFLRFAVED